MNFVPSTLMTIEHQGFFSVHHTPTSLMTCDTLILVTDADQLTVTTCFNNLGLAVMTQARTQSPTCAANAHRLPTDPSERFSLI